MGPIGIHMRNWFSGSEKRTKLGVNLIKSCISTLLPLLNV